MTDFESLISDFAAQTGVKPPQEGKDSLDLVADGMVVSVLHRRERRDCVIFTLPLDDEPVSPAMMRRALELDANGDGTGGHFLGVKAGMFVLSAILPLEGLTAEAFGKRMLSLAAAARTVAQELALATVEMVGGAADAGGGAADDDSPDTLQAFMRV